MRTRNTYPALLALVAIVILGGGMLLKPGKRENKPAISETETARLQRLAQRERLEEIRSYFGAVAADVSASVVHWKSGASGVVWAGGSVLAIGEPDGSGGRETVLGPAGEYRAVRAVPAAPGFSLVRLDLAHNYGLQPVRTVPPGRVDPGSWVVHVSRRNDGAHQFVPAIYSGPVSAQCGDVKYRAIETSVPPGAAMLGGGIFDTEGRLLAVILRCGPRVTAVAAADMEHILASERTPAEVMAQSCGLRVTALDEAVRALLGTVPGVLVDEIRLGSPAGEAGVQPGDVIVAIDGAPVRSVAEVESGLREAAGPHRVEVMRGRRKITLPLSPAVRAGGAVESPAEGVVIRSVRPDSPAGRSGLRAADRVLRINGAAVRGTVPVLRVLAAEPSQAAYVVVRRGDRELGVLVTP